MSRSFENLTLRELLEQILQELVKLRIHAESITEEEVSDDNN